jgi:hypothetical protein
MWIKSKILMVKAEDPDDVIEVDTWLNSIEMTAIRRFPPSEESKANSIVTLSDGVDYFIHQTPEELFKILGLDSDGGIPVSTPPPTSPLNTSM